MERNLAKRIAAIGVVSTITLSGCTTENQANGTNIVDCANGPKTGELKTHLAFGQTFTVGGEKTGGLAETGSLVISFEKGQGVAINPKRDSKIIYFPSSIPQLEMGEVGMDHKGVIFYKDDEIDYQIEARIADDGGNLYIKARCKPQL